MAITSPPTQALLAFFNLYTVLPQHRGGAFLPPHNRFFWDLLSTWIPTRVLLTSLTHHNGFLTSLPVHAPFSHCSPPPPDRPCQVPSGHCLTVHRNRPSSFPAYPRPPRSGPHLHLQLPRPRQAPTHGPSNTSAILMPHAMGSALLSAYDILPFFTTHHHRFSWLSPT